jgi:hypothetical protein
MDMRGHYRIQNAGTAADVCASQGMRLATFDQLYQAWRQGLDECACGWMADGSVGYPVMRPRSGCEPAPTPGISFCSSSSYVGSGWDAYCTTTKREYRI